MPPQRRRCGATALRVTVTARCGMAPFAPPVKRGGRRRAGAGSLSGPRDLVGRPGTAGPSEPACLRLVRLPTRWARLPALACHAGCPARPGARVSRACMSRVADGAGAGDETDAPRCSVQVTEGAGATAGPTGGSSSVQACCGYQRPSSDAPRPPVQESRRLEST